MPCSSSLTERYEEKCRSNSDFINIKTAQKIEQGLGRSVRGERDYSVIIMNGNDLVKFIKSVDSNKFFSEQTRKQINIGIEVSNMAKEEEVNEGKDYTKVLDDLINQCLSREEGWKEFYKDRMEEQSDEEEKFNGNILEILELERKAEESFYKNEPEKAINYLQKIIDSYCANDQTEKGWYLQILARYKYSSRSKG